MSLSDQLHNIRWQHKNDGASVVLGINAFRVDIQKEYAEYVVSINGTRLLDHKPSLQDAKNFAVETVRALLDAVEMQLSALEAKR